MDRTAHPHPQPSALPAWLATVALALGVPALSVLAGASWLWIGYGALSWVAAIPIKILLTWLASVVIPAEWWRTRAAIFALLSAASELGVAWMAVILADTPPGVVDMLAFGIAAGAIEALILSAAGWLAPPSADTAERWEGAARASFCVRNMFFLERGIALAGHTGSRALIAYATVTAAPGPAASAAAFAIVTFMATDGIAYVAHERQWNWMDPAVCRRFFSLLAVIAALELALFTVLA